MGVAHADDVAVRLIADECTAWLRASGEGGWCGFDPSGWLATTWILHAMYERSDLPGGLSHDDEYRIDRAVDPPEPLPPGNEKLRELLANATVVGSPLGASRCPGDGWHRLRWRELARRIAVDPFADDQRPSYRSFGYSSWPVNIRPPAEGALDREQYRCLIDQLAASSIDGGHTECFARYAPCWDMQREWVLTGPLDEARRQYDDPDRRGVPNNIWPADRSWFIYTDYDLCATKVSGPERLIAGIKANDILETVDLR